MLYLVRHAKAGDRGQWLGSDRDRPLDATGDEQAVAIADALADRPIARVLSSPYLRCLQTVGPYALRHGIEIEPHDALAEGAPVHDALALLADLVTAGSEAVLCSHGDVIPEVIDHLARTGVPMPSRKCAKGSIWELDVRDGVVRGGTYHRP